MAHALEEMLRAAARGEFPPADGSVRVVGAPEGRCDAVVAFTAHHLIAADLSEEEVRAHADPSDLGWPMKPPFQRWLEKRLGAPAGMQDLVLAAPAVADAELPLVEREDLREHPRVQRAIAYRTDVRVLSDAEERGVVIVGRGLARRWEVSIEIDEAHRSKTLGRRLIAGARALVPADEPLFAQTSPGNVASVRAFLAAGYRPVCAEVLFLRR